MCGVCRLQYLQMREEERLVQDSSGSVGRSLQEIRERSRAVALGSLDAPIWGHNRSGVFNWLEGFIRTINEGRLPPVDAHCRTFRGTALSQPASIFCSRAALTMLVAVGSRSTQGLPVDHSTCGADVADVRGAQRGGVRPLLG